jgi:hypothetical protein
VGAENLRTWADALLNAVGSVTRVVPGGQVWFWSACDDLRLVGLKLIFLVVTRDQFPVRRGIPPLPSWRRRQRSSIRSIIRARLVCPGRRFVLFVVLAGALERAGLTLAMYRRQLTTVPARDSSTITTPAASR